MAATEARQEETRVFTANALLALLEGYLFVAIEPVTPAEVAKTLGIHAAQVEETFEDLVNIYARREKSGLHIMRIAGGYQIATKSELAQDIGKLLAAPAGKARLSKPALETLAIVAYQQPVTVAEMEAVRGVSVDGVIKTLLDRRLVREDGRKAVPGRPILYATTPEFLHYFGLSSLEDLPPLEDIAVAEAEKAEAHDALQAVGLEE
ncbi:segregation and condensation protein B [Capsulimonas corticalis]|uniref:Segregation and condensation protein B n=1 Tax=Capsulimonas corticalis TaxID=2219043 RepID=A0A402D3I0_9BACT|nr:SMC-Scp complex subunit ScpB [Capsulimonas corticalis]BDI31916.1 segregation and condensation protein B [Capsulimonas corticalis]